MTYAHTTESVFASIRRGVTVEPVTEAEEAALILAAQAGDEAATYDLIRLYAPAIRKALSRAGEALGSEEAEAEVLLAFLEAIASHDAGIHPRLAGRIAERLGTALQWATSATQTFSIPTRTMSRYLAILKAADGDVEEGARIASAHDMDPATFLRITEATRTDSLQVLADSEHTSRAADRGKVLGYGDAADAYLAVEDSVTIESLFALLDERETTITRFSYGFDALPLAEDEDPKEGLAKTREEGYAVANDGVIARHLGMGRSTVARVRAQALSTMREALTGEEA
jgi:DNA-directed RNA polymerase specialized sigma subunit